MKNFTERKPYNQPLGFYKKASKWFIYRHIMLNNIKKVINNPIVVFVIAYTMGLIVGMSK